jgi:peroxiredoxin
MSRKPTIAERLAAARESLPPEGRDYDDALAERFVEAGFGGDALEAGDAMPVFALPNAEGQFVTSDELLRTGPLVISFNRGQWCPFCVAELVALSEALPEFKALGANLVAISPEVGGAALTLKRQNGFAFEVLCDIDHGVSLAFGLLFRLPPGEHETFRKFEVPLPRLYGNDSWFLPVPGTFVVDRQGIIRLAYANPDFRKRLDPDEIVRVLKSMD